jgi:hypothetical protein
MKEQAAYLCETLFGKVPNKYCYGQVSWLVTVLSFLLVAPAAPQWIRGWLKRSCYLQLPVSPGFSPGSLLITPAKGRNEPQQVCERTIQYYKS